MPTDYRSIDYSTTPEDAVRALDPLTGRTVRYNGEDCRIIDRRSIGLSGDHNRFYALIEWSGGWNASTRYSDGTIPRALRCWWIPLDGLNLIEPVSVDALVAKVAEVEAALVQTLASVEAFRVSSGQSRAFRGAKSSSTLALAAMSSLKSDMEAL